MSVVSVCQTENGKGVKRMTSLLDLLKESDATPPGKPEPDQPDLPEPTGPETEPPEPDQPETGQRIIKRVMDSKVIGKVELVFDMDDPDTVLVDSVKYSNDKELENLLLKKWENKMNAEALRRIHKVKKSFSRFTSGG